MSGTCRIDHVLPRWDFRERHRLEAGRSGTAALTQAFEQTTWGDVPAFRAALVALSLGRTTLPRDRPVLDTMTGGGFTILARTDGQLVIGAVVPMAAGGGRVELGPRPAEAFRSFDLPGHYKVALDFRCADGVVATETRVLCTDPASRAQFARYWALIRLPSAVIRLEWLRGIRRRARVIASSANSPEPSRWSRS